MLHYKNIEQPEKSNQLTLTFQLGMNILVKLFCFSEIKLTGSALFKDNEKKPVLHLG